MSRRRKLSSLIILLGKTTPARQDELSVLLADLSLIESHIKVASDPQHTRLFLEDNSYRFFSEECFGQLFGNLAKQEYFFSTRLNGQPIALCSVNHEVEDVLYAVFPHPVIHLFVDGLLIKAVVMPSGPQKLSEVCQLLARAYGGSFSPIGDLSLSLPLSAFKRTETMVIFVSLFSSSTMHCLWLGKSLSHPTA
jgi:hypothetical protein